MQNPQNPYGSPPISSPTGESPYMQPRLPGANDSGMGSQSVLPDELKGLNWGAFLLNWIWAIGHSAWIGLLALIPYVGVIMVFVLLFKGNEFAWQSRKWDSIEQFKEVQRKWTMWGLIIMGASIVLSILIMVLVGALVASNPGAFAPNAVSTR